MEILRHSLNQIDKTTLSEFEIKICNIISSFIERLINIQLSNKSSVEKGLGIDVFLRLKENDFVLYFSITKDVFYINSKYFDIYLYPETSLDIIKLLIEEILFGRYLIRFGYGTNDKLNRKELIFKKKKLKEFNQNNKIGFFNKKVINKREIDGVKFID